MCELPSSIPCDNTFLFQLLSFPKGEKLKLWLALNTLKKEHWWREGGGEWAHCRPKVYQLLLPRVIDIKYGCFTFLLFHLHGLRIVYTVIKLIINQWKSWWWFEYQKTICRRALSNTPPSVSCNIYLVDTSKLVSIMRTVPCFSTHFSVSRSSDETLCVVIDELHLNVFAINIGPSALKVWASSRPTFWRILF